MPAAKRKKRVRKHVIASLSANFVERFAYKKGFTCMTPGEDYGYDLTVFTHNARGEVEEGFISIQLKASDRPRQTKNKSRVTFSIDSKDIRLWYKESYPVIFILYDAKNEIAYWLYIQQYLRNLSNFDLRRLKKSFSVQIVKRTNQLDSNSFAKFRTFKINNIKDQKGVIQYR